MLRKSQADDVTRTHCTNPRKQNEPKTKLPVIQKEMFFGGTHKYINKPATFTPPEFHQNNNTPEFYNSTKDALM